MNWVIAIDIGGTKTNVCSVEATNDEITIATSEIFLTPSNPDHAIQKIEEIVNVWGQKSDTLTLSLPGKWTRDGILEESFSLNDWINYPFVTNLVNKLKIKNIYWETDVICGALGEYYARRYTNDKSLLYLNLGTGIGAALIKDGKPFKSNNDLTLRLQKLLYPYDDELISAVDFIAGKSLLNSSNYKSVEALFKDYKTGNIEAVDIISKAETQLAAWLINLYYLFAPDEIILNGGLVNNFEVLAEGAIEIVNEELNSKVKILPSLLKEKAPIYGALVNVKLK